MRRGIAVAAAALAIALVGAEGAQACSCAGPGGPGSIGGADGVIIGRLLAVKVVDPPAEGEPISSADPADYIYRVGRVYNGGPGLHRGRRVRVRSVRDSASCGLPRPRGHLYGLFLERRNGRWTSSLCGVVSPAELRAMEADGAAAGPPACD
jgi:hypothetical protein